MKDKLKKAVILLIWLGLWQITALFVSNPIYFATPVETLRELFVKLREAAFWQSLLGSLLRILGGFFAASFLAFMLAFAVQRYGWLKEFLAPFVSFLKSVPVTAVAVILLIWWGPRYLVLCISLMVVFPNIYSNMQTGLSHADKELLEMAAVFRLRPIDRFLWICRPAYLPYLHSAVSVSLGMCFKSGIAAEIIGLPEFSIGERLYRDKIYLNTAGVFAWVIVILLLSSLTERLIMRLLKLLSKFPAPCLRPETCGGEGDALNTGASFTDGLPEGYTLYAERIVKSYEGRTLVDTEVKLKAGKIAYLKAPSGEGKSTLLGMLAGTVIPDRGSVAAGRLSMVFQEDRLVESANALRNLKLAGCTGDLAAEVRKLLPERTLMLPASELSGGERRRVAVMRALLHPSDAVIMDEAFTGLDEETKQKTLDWIRLKLEGRSLLFASHGTEAELFYDAEEIMLNADPGNADDKGVSEGGVKAEGE